MKRITMALGLFGTYFAASEAAAETKLTTLDGSSSIIGELIASGDQIYIIKTEDFGTLYINADEVTCAGSGCDLPQSAAALISAKTELPPAAAPLVYDRVQCEAALMTLSLDDGVNFQDGTATLVDDSQSALDRLLTLLNQCEPVKVDVISHTSDYGTKVFNHKLAHERSDFVIAYLTQNGVPQSRLKSVGMGELQPITEDSTQRGRELNDRMEFKAQF